SSASSAPLRPSGFVTWIISAMEDGIVRDISPPHQVIVEVIAGRRQRQENLPAELCPNFRTSIGSLAACRVVLGENDQFVDAIDRREISGRAKRPGRTEPKLTGG